MYATCGCCDALFPPNGALAHVPIGRRIVFDPARGRLWIVCRRCERWNLVPFHERWEALEECERRFRDTRLRLSTGNVGLARLGDGTELVRVGEPLRPELAAWRYGDQFGRRRRRALVAGGALAATVTALAIGAGGLVAVPGLLAAAVAAREDRLRRLLEGRQVVCRIPLDRTDVAVVRAHRLEEARILTGGPWGDRWGLFVSYGEGAVVLADAPALRVAGVILAHLNWTGATAEDVQDAVRLLERHGDAAHCFQYAARRPERESHRLSRLPRPIRLALEMAAHEEIERRVLEGELQEMELLWRDEERVAAIADGLPGERGSEEGGVPPA